jgi:mannitol/fructose-specific phosphotransferase system IIA component (Ntr-type)
MGSAISALLTAAQVDLNLQADNAAGAIHSIVGLLGAHPAVSNLEAFFNEVLAREDLSCTALGYEVASPHARTNAVTEIVIAVGRTKAPVAFGSEARLVRLIFVIGTPPDQVVNYLRVVGTLARTLKDKVLRERLLAAGDADEFLATLS